LVVVAVVVLTVETAVVEANFGTQLRHHLGYLRPEHHSRFKLAAAAALVQLELHPPWLGAVQRAIKQIPEQVEADGKASPYLLVDPVDLVEQVQTVRVQQHHRQKTIAPEL
jgi:hypothetical protein